MNAVSNVVMTVRVRFAKLGKIRFTSHRDVARVWERVLRRVDVPVARSQGFNPHPRLSFGLALSTGNESLGEYLDIDLAERVDVEELVARLDPALPVGLHVQGAAEIAPGTPSLQQAVERCTWRILVGGLDREALAARVDSLVQAESIVTTRERKGKAVTDDVRPAIVALRLGDGTEHNEGIELIADLATQSRGLRPSELVGLLGPDAVEVRTCRLHQWISTDGTLTEPIVLDVAATSVRALEASAP